MPTSEIESPEFRREFALDAVRTDGWFERIGEGIGSFQALCDIVGERFFAFSIIVGARITALTVDRRSPDNTVVDFVVGAEGEDEGQLEPQRLTLADFRRRLVGALLIDEDKTTVLPKGPEDVEGIQLFLGVRYLLLAPLYGYSLQTLLFEDQDFPEVVVLHDGIEEQYELNTFRFRIRAHVREELERAAAGARSAIDLSKVGEAETSSTNGDWAAVVGLLGSWPAPLAIFLRTPEGQMLTGDARHLIAKGLALLGTAYVNLGDMEQAEEVFRIGIQYAQEGVGAGDLFRRLGEAFLKNDRAGEAIGVLRRALASGAEAREALPLLVRAFVDRKKYVAAFACIRQALEAGVPEKELAQELRLVEGMLGASVTRWKARLLQGQAPRP